MTNDRRGNDNEEIMTPGEVIAKRLCTGACMAARGDIRRCKCPRCKGSLHGVLRNVDITGLLDARGRDMHLMTDIEILQSA